LDAVQCAVDAQRALVAHTWSQDERVRVRMGLHTGEPLIATTGYIGMDVHRAARIGDAGHGGQVLLSQATRELVAHDLPSGVTIRSLGEHRLKDMKYPAEIYQLVMEGLQSDFPPLKSTFSGTEPPAPGEPPFKGLQYFDVQDAHLFFGREGLTERLIARIGGDGGDRETGKQGNGGNGEGNTGDRKTWKEGNEGNRGNLLVVVGASGSGKSSVVRAGVIAGLKPTTDPSFLRASSGQQTTSENSRVIVITPTAHPLEALATALTRDSESVTATATLVDDLQKDPRSLHLWLRRQMADRESPSAIRHQPSAIRHTLLVIDQFEELFTLCHDDFEREAFIDNLLYAINQSNHPFTPSPLHPLTLILTLRADFYAHLAQYPELRDAVARNQEYIGPMTTEELRRAMEEPAKRAHWQFEPGLVDLILRDVGDEPGALPLLSHALLETWKRRAGYTMTLKGYADAGGVRGAIAQTAENFFLALTPAQQAIARDIFLRLTELGEGTEDTRRRVSFNEILPRDARQAARTRALLTQLADARLITLGENTVEVAHEALIREWGRLREWLNQDREGLRVHRHLTEAAHEWQLLERDAGALYRGAQLVQARGWAAAHHERLNELERAFLEASEEREIREIQDKEDQQERELLAAQKLAASEKSRAEDATRANQRLRQRAVFLAGAFALAILLAALALFFGDSANRNAADAQQNANQALASKAESDEQRRLATARELAAASVNNLGVDPERSILLAMQAITTTYAIDNTWTAEAEDALHHALPAAQANIPLKGHTAGLYNATFSPDGSRVATSSVDETVKIWDAATGKELLTLLVHSGDVHHVTYSPDGKQLATAGANGTVKIWDANSGALLLTLKAHEGIVAKVVFSPDGKRLASSGINDGKVKVWDSSSGQELITMTYRPAIAQLVGLNLYRFVGLAFSSDGTLITATGQTEKHKDTVGETGHTHGGDENPQGYDTKIWDAATGELRKTFAGHSDVIVTVAFSPDGKLLATGSVDKYVKIWDLALGKELRTLAGHTADILNVTFSADSTKLGTASADGTAKLWDVASWQELFSFVGHLGPLQTIEFDRDGARVVTSSSDKTARVWKTLPTSEFLTISDPGNPNWLSWGPDGKTFATSDSDKVARLWDAKTGQLLRTFAGHTDLVFGVSIHPDGTRLATSSWDKTAKVWDVATGKEILTFRGHTGTLEAIAYSPDGTKIATGSTDKTTKIWDSQTGQELISLSDEASIHCLAWSPDGTRLIAGGDNKEATIWDVTTGEKITAVPIPTSLVFGTAFAADGKRVLTANSEESASVWDATTGKLLLTLKGHAGGVVHVDSSRDGKFFSTTSTDKTVKIWDAATGKELHTLYGHTALVGTAFFSPDGTRILTGSGDKTARVFLLQMEELLPLAHSRVTRGFTCEEKQKFMHENITCAQPTPAPQPTSAPITRELFISGKGEATFKLDLDGDGDIDGSFFEFEIFKTSEGKIEGRFRCAMEGKWDFMKLPTMTVLGNVTQVVMNADGSATMNGIADVDMGNNDIHKGAPFAATVKAGGVGKGTLQLTVIGVFHEGVPGDTDPNNKNYDLGVETVEVGEIVIR